MISSTSNKYFKKCGMSNICTYDIDDNTEIEKRRIANSRGYQYRIVFPEHSRSLFDVQNREILPKIQQESKGGLFYE